MAFDDELVALAARWRLGVQQLLGPTRRCMLCPSGGSSNAVEEVQQRSARGECGLPLDPYGDRPHLCNLSAGSKVRHDPIVEQVGHALRGLGCQTRVGGSLMGMHRKKGAIVARGARICMHSSKWV